MNREIEDLLRSKRPFEKSANTTNTNNGGPSVVNAQDESNTSRNRTRGEGNRGHSRSHKRGHHNTHSRSVSKRK